MPGRGRPTFNKRQKEQKRTDKRLEKEAKREQRKLTSKTLGDDSIEGLTTAEELALEEAEEEESD